MRCARVIRVVGLSSARHRLGAPSRATAALVRRQSDGSWKYIIDNPDATALLKHE